jgi:hypothetical protein
MDDVKFIKVSINNNEEMIPMVEFPINNVAELVAYVQENTYATFFEDACVVSTVDVYYNGSMSPNVLRNYPALKGGVDWVMEPVTKLLA